MPSSSSCTGSYASSPPKTLDDFWPKQQAKNDKMTMTNFREVNRHSELPIARIKKIMKIEDGVKSQMISSEAPVLLAKAAELFIEELTLRSWLHTHDNRRKTIQKGDVTGGAARSEMFDFLIDILPRDEGATGMGQQQLEEPIELIGGENGDDANQQQQFQYVLQYTDGSVPCLAADSLLSVDNGNVLQATQIGQPIPLSATTSGQRIVMAIPGDGQQQFQIVHQMGEQRTDQQES